MSSAVNATVIRLAEARKDIFDRVGLPGTDYCAPKQPPRTLEPKQVPEARQWDTKDNAIPMRGIVRSMLVMATEGAYDLRAGYPDSPYLDRFKIRYAELSERLSMVGASGANADFQFLVNRARTSLAALHDTVQQEIADQVTRDIEIPAFDSALDKVKDTAIAAGVAFGSLDMALKKG